MLYGHSFCTYSLGFYFIVQLLDLATSFHPAIGHIFSWSFPIKAVMIMLVMPESLIVNRGDISSGTIFLISIRQASKNSRGDTSVIPSFGHHETKHVIYCKNPTSLQWDVLMSAPYHP